MSDLRLASIYVRVRLLISALTVLSVALGLGLAIIVLLMSHQTQALLGSELGSWDMVVGAKGSPLQLVLNSLYYMDAPTGNTTVEVWERLQKNPLVSRVIPLNMGDNFFGSPIVGTVPEFFAGRKSANGGPILASGKMFAAPFEAVVGAEVARRHYRAAQLSIGEQQRVAVARALINEPAVVLADEPTASLDPRNAEAVLDLLLGLCEGEGATLVLVTHNAGLAPHFGRCLQAKHWMSTVSREVAAHV